MYLVISASLNPASRSRILAKAAAAAFEKASMQAEFLDLAELELPLCDGASCYSHTNSVKVTEAVNAAHGVLLASPIYNYDISAAAKNMIEITGKAWTDKVVGFLCAAGGGGSYMAPMQIASSLMLDFRCLILPRFVYATGDAFEGQQISDPDCEDRIAQLVKQLAIVSEALNGKAGN